MSTAQSKPDKPSSQSKKKIPFFRILAFMVMLLLVVKYANILIPSDMSYYIIPGLASLVLLAIMYTSGSDDTDHKDKDNQDQPKPPTGYKKIRKGLDERFGAEKLTFVIPLIIAVVAFCILQSFGSLIGLLSNLTGAGNVTQLIGASIMFACFTITAAPLNPKISVLCCGKPHDFEDVRTEPEDPRITDNTRTPPERGLDLPGEQRPRLSNTLPRPAVDQYDPYADDEHDHRPVRSDRPVHPDDDEYPTEEPTQRTSRRGRLAAGYAEQTVSWTVDEESQLPPAPQSRPSRPRPTGPAATRQNPDANRGNDPRMTGSPSSSRPSRRPQLFEPLQPQGETVNRHAFDADPEQDDPEEPYGRPPLTN